MIAHKKFGYYHPALSLLLGVMVGTSSFFLYYTFSQPLFILITTGAALGCAVTYCKTLIGILGVLGAAITTYIGIFLMLQEGSVDGGSIVMGGIIVPLVLITLYIHHQLEGQKTYFMRPGRVHPLYLMLFGILMGSIEGYIDNPGRSLLRVIYFGMSYYMISGYSIYTQVWCFLLAICNLLVTDMMFNDLHFFGEDLSSKRNGIEFLIVLISTSAFITRWHLRDVKQQILLYKLEKLGSLSNVVPDPARIEAYLRARFAQPS